MQNYKIETCTDNASGRFYAEVIYLPTGLKVHRTANRKHVGTAVADAASWINMLRRCDAEAA